MTAQVEELGGDTVRLKVDVPAHDVHHAVEHATSDLAQSVKIPGFRQGKVPVPILTQRLGKERIMAEAVDSHIGGWFWNAAARARIRPVAQPQYDYDLPADDGGDWQFTATVPVQPKVDVVDWTELEVGKPDAEVPEELVGVTARFTLRLPGPADRRAIVERCAAEYLSETGRQVKVDPAALELLVQNLSGLTTADTERLARNAMNRS